MTFLPLIFWNNKKIAEGVSAEGYSSEKCKMNEICMLRARVDKVTSGAREERGNRGKR